MNLPRNLTRIAAGLLAAAAMVTPALAATGTVEASKGLNLRSGADTSAAILTTLPNGTQVEVSGVTGEGWYQVTYQGIQGYVSGAYVALSEADKQSLTAVSEPVYGRVTAGPLNVRTLPSTSGDRVRQLAAGAVVQIVNTLDGWYQISDGYICADYVQIVDASAAVSSSAGEQVVAYAKQFLGRPYVYGASGPNAFDCSGFTSYVYQHFGYSLNRSAAGQFSNGTPVDLSQIQPGDLILWRAYGSSLTATHVGIYIGNNQYIHASSSGSCIKIADLSSSTSRYIVGVRRILN